MLAAIGVAHPVLITATDIEIPNGDCDAPRLVGVCGYEDGWGELGPHLADAFTALLGTSRPPSQSPPSDTPTAAGTALTALLLGARAGTSWCRPLTSLAHE